MDEPEFHDSAVVPSWVHDETHKESLIIDIPGLELMDWAAVSNPFFIEASNHLTDYAGPDFPRGFLGEPTTPGLSNISIDPRSSIDWTNNLVSMYPAPMPDQKSGVQYIDHTLEAPTVHSPALHSLPKYGSPALLEEHMDASNLFGMLSKVQPQITSLERITEESVTDGQQQQLPLRIISSTDKNPGRGRALHSPQVWNSHKHTIKRLYIDEGKPLREVMRMMEEEHNFKASVKMYKTKLGQWKMEKNNTEKEMAQILHVKFRRDTAGKLSSFVRNGKKINIQRYLQRKGMTEYDLVDFQSPANLPSFVRCRTPSPSPEYLSSPEAVRHQELLLLHLRDAIQYQRRIEMSKGITYSWTLGHNRLGVSQITPMALKRAAHYHRQGSVALSLAYLNESYSNLDGFFDNPNKGSILDLLNVFGADVDSTPALNFWKYAVASSAKRLPNHPLHRLLAFVYSLVQVKNIGAAWEVIKSCLQQVAEELERVYGFNNLLMASTWLDLHKYFPDKAEHKIRLLLCSLRKEGRLMEAAGKHDEKDFFRILWWSLQMECRTDGISNHAVELSRRMTQIAGSSTSCDTQLFGFSYAYMVHRQLADGQDAKYNPRHELAIFYLEKCIQLTKDHYLILDLMAHLEEMYSEAGWDEKEKQLKVQYKAETAAYIAKWDRV